METEQFVFFWGGVFSQWYKHNMEIEGTVFNCAEQFMMSMKALRFHDFETNELIMKSKDPREQKALGRKVKNFDPEKWSMVARQMVYRANIEKFSDPELKAILLSTGDKEIVEASPYDTIWGIGLGENDPDRFDKSKWKGTNLLGIILMEVRKDLRERDRS